MSVRIPKSNGVLDVYFTPEEYQEARHRFADRLRSLANEYLPLPDMCSECREKMNEAERRMIRSARDFYTSLEAKKLAEVDRD